MRSEAVEVEVAGKRYRLVSSSPASELRALAEVVDKTAKRFARGVGEPQAMLLTAMALAHELGEERAARRATEARAREALSQLVARIDAALEESEPPPPVQEREARADGPEPA